ncbi:MULTISPECIES: GvpT/GvpP family gas vesicle accessory protein [Priestia]|uniref:GvpT/GvpP family gas vesicle accessory protein n=1 Tax=Priestia aryabhattai TaxID=412384 RepID=A0ABD5KTC7_PRIAR|nr:MULTISPECIES: GvpT/GvpP family gas vesicle accessory protein [Priestia]MBK0294509.1 gas vesicle protein GvpP [Bacillus sp. S34]UPK51854.1 gas vesicle protein GvpP [Bacillus sp. H8-1]AWD68072.1 gas vesicle protein GvpP [Priestia megaterium]KML31108.1 gas vesicle protein GvpP [Priestia aryabhattai]KMN99578.1 gas vesicle protein GvpP [Priestia aryabhattai]
MSTTDKNVQSEKQENQQQEEKTQNSLNLAILGGVVGAGIGLLSSPQTSKKVLSRLGQSEIVRATGQELRRNAQDILTQQAMGALRQTATGYLEKDNLSKLLAPKKKKEETSNEQGDSQEEVSASAEMETSQYEELKEENKNMNDQLQRIEEMLNKLMDAKK